MFEFRDSTVHIPKECSLYGTFNIFPYILGECWSGPEAGDTYFQNGEKDYKHCLKSDYKPCQPGDLNCIGTQYTNYVFKLD